MTRGNVGYVDPHWCSIPCVDPARKYAGTTGSLFKTIEADNPYEPMHLNHYAFKTYEEYAARKDLGSAFDGKSKNKSLAPTWERFQERMKTYNEVETREALDFWLS